MNRRVAGIVAGALVLIAGCSSTGEKKSTRGGGRSAETETVAGASVPVSAPGEVPVVPSADSPNATRPRGDGAAPAPLPAAAAAAPAVALPGAKTKGSIVIGIHDNDAGAAFVAYGLQGEDTDQRVYAKAVSDWINANGGLGGRKIELVYHVTQSLNGSFDQQAESACTDFTEDHKVALAIGIALVPSLNLADCLARHKVPLVWSYQHLVDRATFDRYADYLYQPAMPRAERLGSWADALAAQGFFKDGVVGIIRNDNSISNRFVRDALRPRLTANGVTVKDEIAFRPATGAASAADVSAQANNAVLRLRSNGVNRVLLVPTNGVVPLLFFAAAESQGFRPRYSISSFDGGQFQADNAPVAQLRTALLYGWLPALDTVFVRQPARNAVAQRCLDLTGAATPKGNGTVRRLCDGLFFLRAVLAKGGDTSPAGFRRAVEAMGTSYVSAWTFATELGPGRHDGATAARIATYDASCRCFAYTGTLQPIK